MRPSIRPNRSSADCAIACVELASATSTVTDIAWPPAFSIAATVSLAGFISAATTLAPCSTDQENQTAINAAREVLLAHFAAINARDEQAVNDTLHFPHYRLSQGRLQTWDAPGHYLADFRGRTTHDWHHSELDRIDVIAASDDKVHFDVVFTRYREDDSPIGQYRSLWVISRVTGRWAAQLRSSFAQ